MREIILAIFASFFAGCFVLIFHEFPKTVYFYINCENRPKPKLYRIFQFWHYIDPIGLFFCIIAGAGFSKPHIIQLQSRTLNRRISYVGFLSLIVQFFISASVLRFYYHMDESLMITVDKGFFNELFVYIILHVAMLSLGVFFTNFIPVSFFNISTFISGKAPAIFFDFMKEEHKIKMLLFLILALGIIPRFSYEILKLFMFILA